MAAGEDAKEAKVAGAVAMGTRAARAAGDLRVARLSEADVRVVAKESRDSDESAVVEVSEKSSASKENGAVDVAGEGAGEENTERSDSATIAAAGMKGLEPELTITGAVDVGGAMAQSLGGTDGVVYVAINSADWERVDAVVGMANLADVEAKVDRDVST